jgi:hypothetical protein
MDTTCLANDQSQTTGLNYEISTTWEKKPWTTPQNTSCMLMEPERVTWPKTKQAI